MIESCLVAETTESLPYRPGVGIMLVNADGLVFAGRRIDGPGDAWQMPQGGIDVGESPVDAAFRELEEETGAGRDLVRPLKSLNQWFYYDLPLDLIPSLWDGRFRGQKQKWFLFRFVGTDEQINIATKEPEFCEWRWCTQLELLAKIVPFKTTTYRRVFEAFGDMT